MTAIEYYGYKQDYEEYKLAGMSDEEINKNIGLKMIKDGADSALYGGVGGAGVGFIATFPEGGGAGAIPGAIIGASEGSVRTLVGLKLYCGDIKILAMLLQMKEHLRNTLNFLILIIV